MTRAYSRLKAALPGSSQWMGAIGSSARNSTRWRRWGSPRSRRPRPPACVKTTLRDAASMGASCARRLAVLTSPIGLRVLARRALTRAPDEAGMRSGAQRRTVALRAHVERGERRPRVRFSASTRALSTGAGAVGGAGPSSPPSPQSCGEMENQELRMKFGSLGAMGWLCERDWRPSTAGRSNAGGNCLASRARHSRQR